MRTTKSGGALYLQATIFDWYQEFRLEENEFAMNQAGENGGAVHIDGAGWVNFNTNKFTSNSA